jgi:hypothetical protein
MAIKVAYCFHQNNDVAYRSVFANMPVLTLLALTATGGGFVMARWP